jgi:2-polyprenyl-6-hydroxyphenyl methylase/3-demethylubiquinone-9 3-methyltransferase
VRHPDETLNAGDGSHRRVTERRSPRNDPAQYDDLAHAWWDSRGPFAMLHWIAEARAALIPPASTPGAVLVDVACGGGLLAPHVSGHGYRHVGLDLSRTAAEVAAEHGVIAVRGDAARLPFADASAQVVVAGECLEHVPEPGAVVSELCRILKPGGTLVLDTIAATARARFLAVTVAERIPGGPPPRLHDPALFVDRAQLVAQCARHGVGLRLSGLRPSIPASVGWLLGMRRQSRMVTTRSTAVLFQAVGTKTPEDR